MANFSIRADHWVWQVLQLFGWNGRGSASEAWSILLIGLFLGIAISALVFFVSRFFVNWRNEHLSLPELRDSLPGGLPPSSLDKEIIDLLNLRRRRRQRRIRDRRESC